MFRVPVDYRPNDRAVQWRMTMVAWKVSTPYKISACAVSGQITWFVKVFLTGICKSDMQTWITRALIL
jgi:hypothetical protein